MARKRRIKSVKTELVKKAREAMLAAVQLYNNPQVTFKAESFITLAIIGWTYMLHAYYRSIHVDYRYYFSNPDPYFKPAPLPPDHPRHNFWFDEDGHICVKNPSAFWLPEFTLQKEIGGTIYSVTGTYDGTETLDKKMERIMAEKFTEKLEDSE